MFCPSCAAPNPDDAKFCNQCGWRIGPPTLQGAPAQNVPASTLTGASAPLAASPSQQGGATLSGMSTQDMAASMVTGPSRRTLAAAGFAIGVAGIALGAVVAYRSTRHEEPPPVTPVGLIGEPTAVVAPQTMENDAGTVVPVEPSATPRRSTLAMNTARPSVAPSPARAPTAPAPAPTPARPAPARPTTPARPAPTQTPDPAPEDSHENEGPATTAGTSGNTVVRDDAGNVTVYGADGRPLVQLSRTGGAATPAPAAENGVVERGPRTSAGGFTMGDETDATGTMEPRALQYVYRHYQSQIASCWSSASRNRNVSGVMVVRVRIAEADGHVSNTRIVSDSTRDSQLQACVQNAIRGWRYPQPVGGDVEVDYPLRFGTNTQ